MFSQQVSKRHKLAKQKKLNGKGVFGKLMIFGCLICFGMAIDGCSISGKDNICCNNEGVGPGCAYCTSQCSPNTKGAPCDSMDASCNTVVDCSTGLTTSGASSPVLIFTSHGTDTVTPYSWQDYFTNTNSQDCPVFQCLMREAGTAHDASTTMSNYAADPEATGVTSQGFYITHYDGCYSQDSFPSVANPSNLQFIGLASSPGYENTYLWQFQATDYISKLKSSCSFSNCQWWSTENSNSICSTSTIYTYIQQTDDSGNGVDFTAHVQTWFNVQGAFLCLRCSVTRRDSSTFTVTQAYPFQQISFLSDCSGTYTLKNPTSQNFYVTDQIDSKTVTYYTSWTEFIEFTSSSLEQMCQPTQTQLYSGATAWSCQSDSNTQTYGYIQCDGDNMGNFEVYRDKVYGAIPLKIVIQIAGQQVQTSEFNIQTSCGLNSTTISSNAGQVFAQQYLIHKGGYWNAAVPLNGYNPTFIIKPFSSSISDCVINEYRLYNSQNDLTTPANLTMNGPNFNTNTAVFLTDSSLYSQIATYKFTLGVTASGGTQIFIDYSLTTYYDCQYDNITFIRQIPSIEQNQRADDMIMVGDHPVTFIKGQAEVLLSYDLDVTSIFTNNASSYCPLKQYRIAKVLNSSTEQDISFDDYSQRMTITENGGLWQLTDLSYEFLQVQVFFQAFNGKIWSDINAQYLIQIDLEASPFSDATPPMFAGALFSIQLTYYKQDFLTRDWNSKEWSASKILVISLPEIIEKESLPYTVEFDQNGVEFIFYDEKSNNLTIDQSFIKLINEGTLEVYFKLKDALQNQKEYTQKIEISFEKKAKESKPIEISPELTDFIQAIEQEIIFEEEQTFPQFEQADNAFIMSAKMDKNSTIQISFRPNKLLLSDKIKQKLNLNRILQEKQLLDDIFKLTILPSQKRDQSLTGSKLNFTYESFTIENENTIVIKVEFESPEDVSILDYTDRIKLSVNKTEFKKAILVLSNSNKIIEIPANENIERIVNIPVQLPTEKTLKEIHSNTEMVEGGLRNSGIINIFLSYLMNTSLSLIWTALNILQIISFMVISKLKIPAVTNVLFEQILKLVTFDVIPEEYYGPLQDFILNDLPSDYIYHDQVSQAGFSTGHIISSMFLTFAFTSFFFIKAIVNLMIAKLCKNNQKCQNRVQKSVEQTKLVPSELIRLQIELFLDISVCSFIEILMRQVNTFQERVSYYISIFLLLILVISFIYSIHLIKSQKNKIKLPQIYPKFHTRWATLWEDQVINFDSFMPCFNQFFVIRRFLYASILIYAISFPNYTVYKQLVSILILNLLSTCYLVYTRRFLSLQQQRIETFNETINLLISIQFLAILQISDGRVLTYYGLIINFTIIFLFASNVIIVFGNVFHSLFVKAKQYWTRRAKKILDKKGTNEIQNSEVELQRKNKMTHERLSMIQTLIKTNTILKEKEIMTQMTCENFDNRDDKILSVDIEFDDKNLQTNSNPQETDGSGNKRAIDINLDIYNVDIQDPDQNQITSINYHHLKSLNTVQNHIKKVPKHNQKSISQQPKSFHKSKLHFNQIDKNSKTESPVKSNLAANDIKKSGSTRNTRGKPFRNKKGAINQNKTKKVKQLKPVLNTIQEQTIEHDIESNTNR